MLSSEQLAFIAAITSPAVALLLFELQKFRGGGPIRRVVVVNDCGYVWEDLKPFLPKNIQWTFITRNRSLWGKTFGLFFKILFSRGDYYIANFALQDAWLTQKLKHLDLLICHGGDVRWTINRRMWGWMVRSNLRAAQRVAYTVDDVGETVRSFRPDAFFIRRPVQAKRFVPDRHSHTRLTAVYMEKHFESIDAELVDELIKHECTLTTISKDTLPHDRMAEFLKNFDIIIDQTTYDALSKICLEAMSCGLCAVTYRDRGRFRERIRELLTPEVRRKESLFNRRFVEEHHDAEVVAESIQSWITQ
jgi:hypothetical protein